MRPEPRAGRSCYLRGSALVVATELVSHEHAGVLVHRERELMLLRFGPSGAGEGPQVERDEQRVLTCWYRVEEVRERIARPGAAVSAREGGYRRRYRAARLVAHWTRLADIRRTVADVGESRVARAWA